MTRFRLALVGLLVMVGLWAAPAAAQSLQSMPFSAITTSSTNSTLVSGVGQNILKWIVATNTNATGTSYLKLYNKATAPVCGTDTPIMRIPLFPNTSGTSNGQFATGFDDTRFPLGIGFCVTGALADNDTTSGQSNIAINIGYLWQ